MAAPSPLASSRAWPTAPWSRRSIPPNASASTSNLSRTFAGLPPPRSPSARSRPPIRRRSPTPTRRKRSGAAGPPLPIGRSVDQLTLQIGHGQGEDVGLLLHVGATAVSALDVLVVEEAEAHLLQPRGELARVLRPDAVVLGGGEDEGLRIGHPW